MNPVVRDSRDMHCGGDEADPVVLPFSSAFCSKYRGNESRIRFELAEREIPKQAGYYRHT